MKKYVTPFLTVDNVVNRVEANVYCLLGLNLTTFVILLNKVSCSGSNHPRFVPRDPETSQERRQPNRVRNWTTTEVRVWSSFC